MFAYIICFNTILLAVFNENAIVIVLEYYIGVTYVFLKLPVVSVTLLRKISKLVESRNSKHQFHYGNGDSTSGGVSASCPVSDV